MNVEPDLPLGNLHGRTQPRSQATAWPGNYADCSTADFAFLQCLQHNNIVLSKYSVNNLKGKSYVL